ncbi:MAG: methyltransferase domain-containing protein [Bacteroidota bacterium]|jgi:16S rRNA G527 N7-methylase RsmG
MSAKDHYDNLLSSVYSWFIGDFDEKQKAQAQFFEANGIKPEGKGYAIDLGAGNGLQSVSLAKLGFAVKAIDFSANMLAEISAKKGNLDIETINDDISNFGKYINTTGLIVCMGDTIAHLDSFDTLENLINLCHATLDSNGMLVLSFRDYSEELDDTERFIHVKSDDTKILTCFLEYSPDKIKVTDLLYEKIDGSWELKSGSYSKLRLTSEYVEEILEDAGFAIEKSEVIDGMYFLIAKKSDNSEEYKT